MVPLPKQGLVEDSAHQILPARSGGRGTGRRLGEGQRRAEVLQLLAHHRPHRLGAICRAEQMHVTKSLLTITHSDVLAIAQVVLLARDGTSG